MPTAIPGKTYERIDNDELSGIIESARNRDVLMQRERAGLLCISTEAIRDVEQYGLLPPAECARIHYRWDWTNGTIWHATAYDNEGAILCDAGCDDHWIDAGEELWHVKYAHEYGVGSDDDGLDEVQDASRDVDQTQFHRVSWTQSVAVGLLPLAMRHAFWIKDPPRGFLQ